MIEKYKSALDQCGNWAKELDIPAIGEIADLTGGLLEKKQPVITFVDLSGIPGDLAKIAAYICGEDVLKKKIETLQKWDDWSVKLRYGEKEEWLEGSAQRELILAFPAGILKDKEVVLLCAGNIDAAFSRDVSASEQLYLLINATMPMTKNQVDWIQKFVQKYFDFKRFYLCLMGMEFLLQEEQQVQVAEYIISLTKPYGNVALLKTEEDVRNSIMLVDQDKIKLMEASGQCVMRNMADEITQILMKAVERSNVKEEEYEHTKQQLEKQRTRLISAGKLTADNMLDNQIRKIINAVADSAEEYSEAMSKNIKDAVRTAKDIEDVESKIRPYMERSWSYFAQQTSVQLAKDFDIINADLTKRMEEDIDDMLQMIDVSSRDMLAQFVMGEMEGYAADSFYKDADGEALKAVSRNARNMMLMAIPLLFVSPSLSVAALIGGGIYNKISKKQEEEKYRKELSIHVERACSKAGRSAVKNFTHTLEQERERMRELVLEGYGRLVDLIQEELCRQQKYVDESSMKARRMEEVLHQELHKMRSMIQPL